MVHKSNIEQSCDRLNRDKLYKIWLWYSKELIRTYYSVE